MPAPLFPFVWQYNNQTINTLANNVALLLPQYDDYTTNVAFVNPPAIPFIIYPTLIESGTKIIDAHTLTPNLPVNNLSGWKIGGSIVLQGQNSYSISVGTLTVENSFGLLNDGLFVWKTSGTASAQESPSYIRTIEPLGLFNTATDLGVPSLTNYVQVKFTFDYVSYPPTGTTLEYNIMLTVDRCSISETPTLPTDEIEIIISFELEFLINDFCTITYVS
jgi:hypothetical protein